MAEDKKAVGKYLLFNEGGFFYKYRLMANNGQALIISEAYKDEKACRQGIETLKKNIDTLKVDFEEYFNIEIPNTPIYVYLDCK